MVVLLALPCTPVCKLTLCNPLHNVRNHLQSEAVHMRRRDVTPPLVSPLLKPTSTSTSAGGKSHHTETSSKPAPLVYFETTRGIVRGANQQPQTPRSRANEPTDELSALLNDGKGTCNVSPQCLTYGPPCESKRMATARKSCNLLTCRQYIDVV